MGNITSKRSVEISSTPKKGVVEIKDETKDVVEEKVGNGDVKVEETKEEIKEILKEDVKEDKEEVKEEDTKEEKGEGDQGDRDCWEDRGGKEKGIQSNQH